MSIILRVDDFPGTKPAEFWKHNLENFKRFDDLLGEYVDLYVLGVIPKYTTPEMIDFLEMSDRIQVALHGVEHDENYLNEFRDYETEDEVLQKILSAKEPLKNCNAGVDIIDYIPPHNVIDVKTIRALFRAGFRRIYGGPGTDQSLFTVARSMGFETLYSHHPIWYGRSDELLNRDEAHKVINLPIFKEQQTVLTIHWPWEWNIGLDNLRKFLEEIKGALR